MDREMLVQVQGIKKDYIKQSKFLSDAKKEIESKYSEDVSFHSYSEEDRDLIRSIQKVRSELKSKLAVLNFLTGETSAISSINWRDIRNLKKGIGLKGFPDVKVEEE